MADAYIEEHGRWRADGEPQPVMRLYVSLVNSARLCLGRLEEHLGRKGDRDLDELLGRYGGSERGRAPLRREQIVLADGRSVGEALDGDEWIERDFLRPVFENDEQGLPRYRLVYIEVPRGHWKSGGAAAIACAEAMLNPNTDVLVAAADRDQAAIVGENIDGYAQRNRRFV